MLTEAQYPEKGTNMKISYAIAAISFATAAFAEDEMDSVSYLCDRGVEVAATYLNVGDFSGAVVQADGRQIPLTTAVAASGARYVSADEGATYTWWTKGSEATLFWRYGQDEDITLLNCTVKK